ncbi:uncharacterized protein LOC131328358 [Rhododendron vialii]|uniref:uncharacterized protein LOC131328358 n=1 Tax=Rhododendron vialii TaxID=182163 RepID=UPI00265E6236|nr:uncharacterized protein LOC131328358 [Rhododendron vialii]
MVSCQHPLYNNGKPFNEAFRKVLPSIIGEAQAAFVGGKQILDGVLIANQVIHYWKQRRSGGLILKIDFEKAYDCVNWNFPLDMLNKFGCGRKWGEWVKACISTTSLSFLINGSPTEEIYPQKGLTQGDILYPHSSLMSWWKA